MKPSMCLRTRTSFGGALRCTTRHAKDGLLKNEDVEALMFRGWGFRHFA